MYFNLALMHCVNMEIKLVIRSLMTNKFYICPVATLLNF